MASCIQLQARRKQYRVYPTRMGSSAKGAGLLEGSGGMLPREILKFLAHSQRELTRKLTETYGENCMCLAPN